MCSFLLSVNLNNSYLMCKLLLYSENIHKIPGSKQNVDLLYLNIQAMEQRGHQQLFYTQGEEMLPSPLSVFLFLHRSSLHLMLYSKVYREETGSHVLLSQRMNRAKHFTVLIGHQPWTFNSGPLVAFLSGCIISLLLCVINGWKPRKF